MSLLDELKQQKAEIAERLERACADVQYFDGRMADLLLAIAALEPTPATIVNTDEGWELEPSPDELFEAEKSEAREQLEREPEIPEGFTKWEGGNVSPVSSGATVEIITTDKSRYIPDNVQCETWRWSHDADCNNIIAYRIIEASPAPDPDEQDDASEFAEPMPDPEFVVLDEQTCEPVEEAPALNADMQDEREQPVTDVAALIASGEHSYDEVAAIAYPEPVQIAQGSIADVAQPEWNGPTLPGGYAPVTSPEADEAAKAHEYYDPKAVAERDRNAGMARLFSYNPFYKPKVDA